MTSSQKSRNWALDCLRLAAVLLVICRHQLGQPEGVLAPLWQFVHRGGGVGVDLFFVLSGYLVSGLLFKEYALHRSLDWKRFLVRRGLKIYPAFYLWLAAMLIPLALKGKLPPWGLIFSEACFVQNYFGTIPPHHFHTWSLAVEEHFYLLLTGLLVFLAWRGRGAANPFSGLPKIVIGMAMIFLGFRLLANRTPLDVHFGLLAWSHLRMDSLAFGVLLAYRAQFHRAELSDWVKEHRLWLVLGGMAALIPAFTLTWEGSWWLRTFGFTCNYLGAGALVLVAALAFESQPPSRLIRLAAWLGASSYSIYLWHMEVILRLHAKMHLALGIPITWTWIITLFACLGVGVFTGWIIEWPILRWRDRLYPSRSQKLAI